MLTLYYKPTCAFSQHVIGEAEAMGLKLDLKDISTDEVLKTELMEMGGKAQVPFLVDADRGESLYESNDIVAYLEKQYAASAVDTRSVAPTICDACQ